MAVGIMSPCCRASLLFLLSCFLQVQLHGRVFQDPPLHDVVLRSKRANNFLLEEILQGNLERECFEEMCNYEEARECFEDDDKTLSFWTIYYDGDQCEPNPCLHGGNCTDSVGRFICSCPAPHSGPTCELVEGQRPPMAPQIIEEVPQCPTEGPTACQQLCTVNHKSFTCSCLPGFKLQSDKRTCEPEVKFPCGIPPGDLNSTALMCRHGNCPWQVTLMTHGGAELCAGVLLGRRSVLTAASCLFRKSEQISHLRPSDFLVLAGNRKVVVSIHAFFLHERYRPNHHDNDLVLLELGTALRFSSALIHLCLPTRDFCENVLMHSGKKGIADRSGVGWPHELVYMTLDECRTQLNVSHPLSNKMFCMKRRNKPPASRSSAQEQRQNQTETEGSKVSGERCGGLLPGTPVVTANRGTVFVTGLLMSSSTRCESGGLVFTKLSRYLNWIKPRLSAAEDHMTPQVMEFP